MGSLLSTLVISGLSFLHAWLFIEIQLNEVVVTKLDKNNDPKKITFQKI